MKPSIGFIMDPLESIKPYKDSTFAMMLEAQKRGWHVHYIQTKDLYLKDSQFMLTSQIVQLTDDVKNWFSVVSTQTIPATDLNVLFMRQDPPFDIHYLNTTYLLEHAKANGVFVLNDPRAIRDANEKMYALWFPECCAPYVVTSQALHIKAFLEEYKDIILKPLDSMGGASVFRVQSSDPNLNVIIETLTQLGQRFIMAQKYISAITKGDKRILLIDGEPIPYALARLPAKGETRANLVAGGTPKGQPLSERDRWICQQVGPTLKQKGLLFVGLDVIGDYLTEINVTSPTCIRELEKQFNLNITGTLFDAILRSITP